MKLRNGNFPVIKRYWDDEKDCEPIYPLPCIVWWMKGDEDNPYFHGELLCQDYPHGEIVDWGYTLDDLVNTLIDTHQVFAECEL